METELEQEIMDVLPIETFFTVCPGCHSQITFEDKNQLGNLTPSSSLRWYPDGFYHVISTFYPFESKTKRYVKLNSSNYEFICPICETKFTIHNDIDLIKDAKSLDFDIENNDEYLREQLLFEWNRKVDDNDQQISNKSRRKVDMKTLSQISDKSSIVIPMISIFNLLNNPANIWDLFPEFANFRTIESSLKGIFMKINSFPGDEFLVNRGLDKFILNKLVINAQIIINNPKNIDESIITTLKDFTYKFLNLAITYQKENIYNRLFLLHEVFLSVLDIYAKTMADAIASHYMRTQSIVLPQEIVILDDCPKEVFKYSNLCWQNFKVQNMLTILDGYFGDRQQVNFRNLVENLYHGHDEDSMKEKCTDWVISDKGKATAIEFQDLISKNCEALKLTKLSLHSNCYYR